MSELRSNLVFVALVLGQLVLLSSQVRDEGGTSQLEKGMVRAVGPLAQGVTGVLDGGAAIGERLKTRAELRRENEELHRRVDELLRASADRLDLQDRVDRLSAALGYEAPFDGESRLADVVYIDHSSWLRTLLIYEPGSQAVENTPVTSLDGVVGRVILREGPYAKVQLLTDRAAATGGMIERTRRQGIVRGAGNDGLTLEYLPVHADVQVGDRVVTSGTDGIFPRGLLVGVVVEATTEGELFQTVRLRPAVDFGTLDQVFVLLRDALPGPMEATTSASP